MSIYIQNIQQLVKGLDTIPLFIVIIITKYITDEDIIIFINSADNLSKETHDIFFKKIILKNPCAKIYEEYNNLLLDACSFRFIRTFISQFEMKKMDQHLEKLRNILNCEEIIENKIKKLQYNINRFNKKKVVQKIGKYTYSLCLDSEELKENYSEYDIY